MEKINPMSLERYANGIAAMVTAVPAELDTGINLQLIAYENNHTQVFHAWMKLDRPGRQQALHDRYVFYSYSCCAGHYFGELRKLDFEKANSFVAEVLEDIAYLVHARISFTEEWFKGIDRLIGALTDHNFLPEARSLVAVGLRTGVGKFPRLAQSISVHAAYLDALVGRREKAAKVALQLVRRPYLLPNRRELPALCFRLMYILAAGNHLREYRLVLWTGVTQLLTSAALRDAFSDQIVKTYRGAFRAVLHSDVPVKYRWPFFLINMARILSCWRPLALIGLDKPWRWAHSALLYLLDRLAFKKNELFREANRAQASSLPGIPPQRNTLANLHWPHMRAKRKKILITRAMGGIGDLLMMTPGIQALSTKFPTAQIDFAIPKSFHPIFDGLPGVRLLNIDEDEIDLSAYKRWINLTDCPAGRIESRQSPNVRRNRIEIFAKAMGISKIRLRSTAGFLPYYQVKDDERVWAREYLAELNPDGKPVIGIQPFAADSYRNWPYMEQFVAELSRTHCVLVFHHEPMTGYEFENTFKIVQPLRKCLALLSLCQKLVVLDSSFLHFSAALRIPTIAIFGAISGRLRTRNYPNVQLLAPKKEDFPCYPCWRNEHKPCHLTSGRESICFRSISVGMVLDAVQGAFNPGQAKKGVAGELLSWVRYGRE